MNVLDLSEEEKIIYSKLLKWQTYKNAVSVIL
jgi:hypothetical protein